MSDTKTKQARRPYRAPVLREYDLLLDEAYGLACKQGTAVGPHATCQGLTPCSGSTGS